MEMPTTAQLHALSQATVAIERALREHAREQGHEFANVEAHSSVRFDRMYVGYADLANDVHIAIQLDVLV